jgi:hypothetical protein
MTDIFLSDGGSKYPALKFENVNDTHSGTVIEVKKLEDRDPAGTVKTWDNGDVRYVFVFTMNTADGIANLWARGNLVKAIREAAQAIGATTMVGTKLTVKYTGDGEKKSKAFNAPKLYKAKVEPAVKDDSESMW